MTGRITIAAALAYSVLAALAACADDTSTSADVPVQIEDSAGVRIVAYQGAPPARTAFHLAPEPSFTATAPTRVTTPSRRSASAASCPTAPRSSSTRGTTTWSSLAGTSATYQGARHGGRGAGGGGQR